MTPPDDNSSLHDLYHWLADGIIGLAVAYLEWTRKRNWDALATKVFVMERLEEQSKLDEARDAAAIEAAIKPLRDTQKEAHDDLSEIKREIKTLLRAVGRLEGD